LIGFIGTLATEANRWQKYQ